MASRSPQPLGPLHATVDGRLDDRIGGGPARAAFAKSDLGEVGLALRVPGDREYWPRMFAGGGPYARGALLDAGGEPAISVTAGLALYGAD
ncbi:MAG: hypothetical protein ABI467_06655 [Kofleriaceae bacterium]